MEFAVQVDAQGQFIHVKESGEWEPETCTKAMTMAGEMLAEHGLTRILVDHRDLSLDLSMMEIHDRPMQIIKEGHKIVASTAYIYPTGKMNEYHFFEDVATTRGLRIRVFPTPELALDWLMQD